MSRGAYLAVLGPLRFQGRVRGVQGLLQSSFAGVSGVHSSCARESELVSGKAYLGE